MGVRGGPNGRSRLRVGGVIGGALVLALALGGCEWTITQKVNDQRTAAGRAVLPTSGVATDAARAHSAAMCAAGAVTPSADPEEEYDQETSKAVREVVGSAPLDATVADVGVRNGRATNDIWEGWKSDPTFSDARWDDIGVGETTCAADNTLYMTAVLRDAPSMPTTGLYSSPQYDAATIQHVAGLQYGSAVNVQGVNQALLLDVYMPPGAPSTPRPTMLLFHGGGFVGGNRTVMQPEAISFAQRGYVAVTVSYRLSTSALMSQPNGLVNAASNGIDDGLEAVRWLRANAATYGIATNKIGTLGVSAGGAITLGMAMIDDPTPGGPLAAYSSAVQASVSTGAYLTPAIGTPLLTFEPTDAPAMLLHYENDTTTGQTDEYAFETCTAARAGGNTCDPVTNPGNGHTAWVQPGGTWWQPKIGPFLWTHLGLG
jgi:dienelactone hydrolase